MGVLLSHPSICGCSSAPSEFLYFSYFFLHVCNGSFPPVWLEQLGARKVKLAAVSEETAITIGYNVMVVAMMVRMMVFLAMVMMMVFVVKLW